MKENKGTMESVTLGRVPDSERKNWWTVALIQAGIMISIPCIMVGSTLASGMGLGDATIAIVVGYAIAVFFMTLIGMQSSDLGRPMCVVASSAFGKTGVRIFMMTLFSAALICWFGYQSVVCGEAFSNLLKEFFGINFSVTASIILWGVIMLVTAVWGINALGWLNNIAIPALVIVIGIAAVIAFNTYDVPAASRYTNFNSCRHCNGVRWSILRNGCNRRHHEIPKKQERYSACNCFGCVPGKYYNDYSGVCALCYDGRC